MKPRPIELDNLTDQLLAQAVSAVIREAFPNWPEPRTSIDTRFVFEMDGVDYYVTLTVQVGESTGDSTGESK